MKFLTSISAATFKRSVLAAAVTASCATSAFALPTFTFDPTAFCTTCGASTITANNVLVSDYSTVTFGLNNSFTDTGYLQVTGFQDSIGTFTPTGLNSRTGGGYSLYIPFTATGFTTSATGGVFDTLTYSFVGAPGSVSGANANAGAVVLATGSLISGTTTTAADPTNAVPGNAIGLVPGANVKVTFAPTLAGFFTDPIPFYNMAFSAFINTPTEVATNGTSGFTITQGGGTLNFLPQATVPEPGTLALLGLGMLGFALRKRKQA